MNTKKKVRPIIEMAEVLEAPLPSDGYGSTEEWRLRYAERLKDGGYTPSEIEERCADTLRKAQLRDTARATLNAMLDARSGDEDDNDARGLLLMVLRQGRLFTSIKPGRDLARLAKHVAYFSKRSVRIREAYRFFFSKVQTQAHLPAVQAWLQHDVKKADAFARQFGSRLWAADEHTALGFYGRDQFVVCPRTRKEMPAQMGLTVVVNDDGRTQRLHPSLADSPDIVRDPISGALVLRDAVEWVTLDTGEQAWKRHNLALGAIFFDEEQSAWIRMGRGAVAGYHGARREWRERDQSSYRGCIGVELEIGFKSTGQLQKFLNRYVDERGRFVGNRPFLVENDSSLSGITGGVEIVSEPLSLYEGYQAPNAHWRWLLEQLVKGGAEGWRHRARAGIHVNMDTADKTPNQVVRFVAFINNAASLSRFISGRKAIYGHAPEGSGLSDSDAADLKAFEAKDKNAAAGGFGKFTAEYMRDYMAGDRFAGTALPWLRQGGKYRPVNVRSNSLIEVRIFGSNIRYEGFMSCVEYCVAGMAFVCGLEKDTDVFASDIGEQFRKWLAHNVATYPNLAARIGVEESTEAVVARPLQELVA